MRRVGILIASLCVAAGHARAQTALASRIATAADGIVRMQYDARPGTCGDGHDVIAYKESYASRRMQSYGGWNDAHCVAGPLRIALTLMGGQVVRLRAQVGGTWSPTDAHVTDLGIVSPESASAFLFSLVPRLESSSEHGRILLAAVLAYQAPVIAPLLSLARDDPRRDDTRRDALHWIGMLGDASVVPVLVGFARGDVASQRADGGGEGSLAGAATAALRFLDGGVGIPALVDLSRSASVSTRRNAVFWLGQSGDPRAIRTLHAIIENEGEDIRVRSHAIFSLANSDETAPAEFDYLRLVYSRLDDDQLKDAIFQGMTGDHANGAEWLLARARDPKQRTELRKKALFWAGQGAATNTAEIVDLYRTTENRDLREHALFVLSQRHDDAAVDALLAVARSDDDARLRGKALFWLAQKHDARVTRLITDLLVK